MRENENIVGIGMRETAEMISVGTEVSMRPGAVLYERIKPYVERFISKHIIRPHMSPWLRHA